MIANFLFEWLHIPLPTYLDIGAHHPTKLSNTYFFYQKGARGVCVEPDPELHRQIKEKRKKDICLNVGVGSQNIEADFYLMSSNTLNTFSKVEAERYQIDGKYSVVKKIVVPIIEVNKLIEEYFDGYPNFVSLDVEGLDYEILNSFDFQRFRPEVFCIETLTFTVDNSERKISETIDLMKKNNYMVYGDTYINTIFVDNDIWSRR